MRICLIIWGNGEEKGDFVPEEPMLRIELESFDCQNCFNLSAIFIVVHYFMSLILYRNSLIEALPHQN